jgi:FMN phosphatase YigB (HAD superfamily)
MLTPQRVVIWDVDDVLNELEREWFEDWWLPRHPECTHRFADITANPPHRVLGITEQTYLTSLDEFREARFAALTPRPEVLEWFSEHGHRSRHVALTAPPEPFAHVSAGWVIKHFGQWIRTYAFVPARRGRPEVAEPKVAKRDYLEWLGHGDVFLDDREDNVAGARALGLKGIVVPQPWSVSAHGSFRAALQELTAVLHG